MKTKREKSLNAKIRIEKDLGGGLLEMGHLNISCGIEATEKRHERGIGGFKGSA
ncbi:hypothetical protein WN51_03511 [Melipona quadrifasciata]|uniref:Uncharacterized protein n=1 Tax=Melipona quadrifasciata TaxID=166423 RepID=A0A0M8ZUK8_9HYME|nr:hypothetical protein WN51_03511 [Melipona quadrifasciata]